MGRAFEGYSMQKTTDSLIVNRDDLQQCRGALAQALKRVNTCLLFNKCDLPETHDAMETFLAVVADRKSGLELHAALGSLRWPGTYGSSPWEELFSVLRAAIHGHAASKDFGRISRILHQDLIERLALPSAVKRLSLDEAGRKKRYPRLLEAMRQGALLTHGEADAALRMLLNACPGERARTCPSSEAVDHFGGNLRVVHQARRWRHLFRHNISKLAKPICPPVVAVASQFEESLTC